MGSLNGSHALPDPGPVMVLAPTAGDARLTCRILESAGMECIPCDASAGFEELDRAGCLVFAEEAMLLPCYPRLRQRIAAQPSWSDLPVVVITLKGSNSFLARTALEELGNVALIERPLHTSSLISLVRASRRARQKQRQVCDQLEALAVTARDLERLNGAKDELLAFVSHELRTPLVSILGNSELLLKRTDLPEDEQIESLRHIKDDAQRLHRVIENMLVLAKAELLSELVIEPILLQHVLPRLIANPGGEAKGRPRVELEIEPGLPPVQGNEVYVEQVVSNLIGNAQKYGVPGAKVRVHARPVPGAALVVVENDGSVLDPATVERIFTPFERGDQRDGPIPGLGLGLAVCKRLVEAMGGTISATARPEGGLRVEFELPEVPEE